MSKDKNSTATSKPERLQELQNTLKLFKNWKPLTEEQLEKLSLILDDTSQFGLLGGSQSLGMAYIEFCFTNKLSDADIRSRINQFIHIYTNTGQSPMTDEQMKFYIAFLEKKWEDVAIAYFTFIIKGKVSLEYADKDN